MLMPIIDGVCSLWGNVLRTTLMSSNGENLQRATKLSNRKTVVEFYSLPKVFWNARAAR
jgi:hypothetical protein